MRVWDYIKGWIEIDAATLTQEVKDAEKGVLLTLRGLLFPVNCRVVGFCFFGILNSSYPNKEGVTNED